MLIPDSWGSPLQEANPCNLPAGTPKGGQFGPKGACGPGGRTIPTQDTDDDAPPLINSIRGIEDALAYRDDYAPMQGMSVEAALTALGVPFETVTSVDGSETVYAVGFKNNLPDYQRVGVVDSDGYVRSADDWMADADLDAWLGPYDHSDHPMVLYHATPEENVESILADGLGPMNKTRGLHNRWVGAAVFTRSDPESLEIGSYGNSIFEIDLDAMKKALGEIPHVEREEVWVEYERRQALAHKMGLYDLTDHRFEVNEPESDGTTPDDWILYAGVPARFLKLLGG